MTEHDDYSDLLDLPHPTFPGHPPMPMRERAAQFAPFAALTGFEEEIEKTRLSVEQTQSEAEDHSDGSVTLDTTEVPT